MKRIIPTLLVLLLLTAAGCGNPVRYRLAEDYTLHAPVTVAVLPVEGAVEDREVKEFFRAAAAEKLRELGYDVIDPARVDEVYVRVEDTRLNGMSPKEAASLLGTDAVLHIDITKWRKKLLTPYASLKVGAEFVLYASDGRRLWKARYRTKESDLRLDRQALEFGIIKAYEPRIERIVGSVFVTLPSAQLPEELDKKEEEDGPREFFQWLP